MLQFRTNTNQWFAKVENKSEIKSYLKSFEKGVKEGSWEKFKGKTEGVIIYRALDDEAITHGNFLYGAGVTIMFFKSYYAIYKPN